jgi:hypothetical protein
MRDIATATLTGNLTREVELRPLPSGTEVARLRVASGTRRRSGEEWVDRTNYFTVEVYGPQANLAPSGGLMWRFRGRSTGLCVARRGRAASRAREANLGEAIHSQAAQPRTAPRTVAGSAVM